MTLLQVEPKTMSRGRGTSSVAGALRHRLRRDVQFETLRRATWRVGPSLDDLVIDDQRTIALGDHAAPAMILVLARLAGEWAALVRLGAPISLAGWAAARVAAQFARAERFSLDRGHAWLDTMADEAVPSNAMLQHVMQSLARYWTGLDPVLCAGETARITALWPMIGTSETIMETGGDIRLLRDPQTDLNGYGCSHRPRPWAVTFASSTASSASERGYGAADRFRMRLTATMLAAGSQTALHGAAAALRQAIARAFRLPRGGAVVLAASGTDSELLALALCHLPTDDRPITTILLAPEETGSGVPMAAIGRHFAVDTANGHDVSRSAPIAGFRDDTALVAIPLRDQSGAVRPPASVEADIIKAVTEASSAGRHVILHALDLSKTGLLSPSLDLLRRLRGQYGAAFDIVVDACQLRIAPDRLADYLALDAIVQVTGSKFLTGPPFAGAALLPAAVARRLKSGALPSGLDAYFSQGDWPRDAAVAQHLPDGVNYGLLLRWHAALAEYRAFAAIAEERKAAVIDRFEATIRQAIDRHGIFALQPVPKLARDGDRWDGKRTIFAFAVRDPARPAHYLDPAAMRLLYRWLNADCGPLFEVEAERTIAARICHIGQPVALPNPDGGQTGWLRVSAGARLISGEPSHRGLAVDRRVGREMADLALVFDKIALLCAHWDRVAAADPVARYI